MTALSRKLYQALAAKYLRLRPATTEPGEVYQQWEAMVIGTVNTIEQFNGSFDRGRFLKACGHEPVTWYAQHDQHTRSAEPARS